ncbi:hypothetical protein BO94DRAFT_31430 [Aspergillus sclerotioniger CBS 115572]|uniref:Uncharacterized protein n=1 Tax=Aspergillus sclerotioniger CBS 115572 TaxID=1450535 RepID=A0A317WXI2_9EURO|nr:hypothetical protein BO94DRAFT_31430 [Aspergillus sclerotioniger CBS 115572]PWY90601.1 hypothetical protein BO94DRAFT_31430 [Aspergillus sclerotioniger CBS 115572]
MSELQLQWRIQSRLAAGRAGPSRLRPETTTGIIIVIMPRSVWELRARNWEAGDGLLRSPGRLIFRGRDLGLGPSGGPNSVMFARAMQALITSPGDVRLIPSCVSIPNGYNQIPSTKGETLPSTGYLLVVGRRSGTSHRHLMTRSNETCGCRRACLGLRVPYSAIPLECVSITPCEARYGEFRSCLGG